MVGHTLPPTQFTSYWATDTVKPELGPQVGPSSNQQAFYKPRWTSGPSTERTSQTTLG
jgi:hypothetical protein